MPSTKRNATSSTRSSSRARTKRDFLNPANATTQLHDNQKESAVARQDPLERKGREFWASSITRSQRFLGKFADSLADWGFYPLMHGSCQDVKKIGIQGVHYARGYKELGSMVDEYTTDISQWPELPSHPLEEQNQNNESQEDASVDTVQMSVQSPETAEVSSNNWTPENVNTVNVIFREEVQLIQTNPRSFNNLSATTTGEASYNVNVEVSDSPGQAVVSPSTNENSGENTYIVQKQQLSLLARVQYLETRAYGEEQSFPFVERLRRLENDFLEKDFFDEAKKKTFKDRLHQLEEKL